MLAASVNAGRNFLVVHVSPRYSVTPTAPSIYFVVAELMHLFAVAAFESWEYVTPTTLQAFGTDELIRSFDGHDLHAA